MYKNWIGKPGSEIEQFATQALLFAFKNVVFKQTSQRLPAVHA